jgi:hypothetical protein
MNNSRLWLTVSTVLILIVSLTTACGAGEPQVITVIVTHEATTPSEIEQEPTLTQVPSEIAVTATPSTSDLALLVHAEFARLAAGHILYNPPDTMRVGQKERVEVRITQGMTETLVVETVRGRGAPVVEQIPVSTFMKVRLTGDAFAISPLSSEEQFVIGDSYTEWVWDVTPLRAGERTLTLLVTARVLLAGFPAEQRDLKIIERPIKVAVNPISLGQDLARENRAVLISVVLIPLIVAIIARLRRRFWAPTPADPGSSAEEQ